MPGGLVLGPDGAQGGVQTAAGLDLRCVLLGIWSDRQVRERRGRLVDERVVDYRPGVQRHAAGGRHPERVDVDLAQLGIVGHQVREAHQHLEQPVEVHGRAPAVPAQERPYSQRLQHASGQPFAQGWQPEGTVAQHLGFHPARADEDHRPEGRVLSGPHQKVVAGRRSHRLHGHPGERRGRRVLGYRGKDPSVRRPHLLRGLDPDRHPANVGLVRYLG